MLYDSISTKKDHNLNQVSVLIYISIAEVLNNEGLFDMAKIAIVKARSYCSDIKIINRSKNSSVIDMNTLKFLINIRFNKSMRSQNESNEKFEIIKSRKSKLIKSTEEYIEKSQLNFNSYINCIYQAKNASEAFGIIKKLMSNDIYISNKIIHVCRLSQELSRKGNTKLAEGILDELINFDISDNDLYIYAETYLKLGFFKKAFKLIDGKAASYLIYLICSPNTFVRKNTELSKKNLLDCLSKLVWTNQTIWLAIYDICESAQFKGKDKENTNSWLSRCLVWLHST